KLLVQIFCAVEIFGVEFWCELWCRLDVVLVQTLWCLNRSFVQTYGDVVQTCGVVYVQICGVEFVQSTFVHTGCASFVVLQLKVFATNKKFPQSTNKKIQAAAQGYAEFLLGTIPDVGINSCEIAAILAGSIAVNSWVELLDGVTQSVLGVRSKLEPY
ncbi:hypothetical protein U1Q18_018760, partial [Sarracenia purpurea var. burkii]